MSRAARLLGLVAAVATVAASMAVAADPAGAVGVPAEAPVRAGGGAPAVTDSTQVPDLRSVSFANLRMTGVDTAPSGHVGVDLFLGAADYAPCFNPADTKAQACALAPPSYYDVRRWSPSGSDFAGGIFVPNSEPARDDPSLTVSHGFANKARRARVEVYPYGPGGTFDPYTQDYGGVAFWVEPLSTLANGGVYSPDIGTVRLPRKGQAGVGRLSGAIRSNPANPLPDRRFNWQVFQTGSTSTTSAGYPQGAFSLAESKGATWTTGYVYAGEYIVFVEDTLLGNKVSAVVSVSGDTAFDLDADAACFGFDTCEYLKGAPVQPSGGFHPVNPTRVLDTRQGLGHPSEKVRAGEGASADPNPFVRAAELVNHEVRVAGVGGVPASGVSAVLVNVTAVNATAASYLTVFPKPPRRSLFDDQSSFPAVPFASNLNMAAGQVVPNLVVAKVGAGGKVRLYNNTGAVDVLFDVVGWFDTAGAAGGDGFTGVTPTRVLDTRDGTGGWVTPFGAGEVRTLAVAGAPGGSVPADATAVVANVTAVFPTAASHLTVFPGGAPVPVASNLNMVPGQIVPNLVVVPVGAGGTVSVRNNSGAVHVLMDVVGYFGGGGAGGRLTPRSPVRVLDTRSGVGGAASPFGPGAARDLTVAGVGGVPPGATAVVLNVTATGPTAASHVTVWPNGVAMPTASNLNVTPGLTVANLVMVRVGDGGKVRLFNNSGTTHLIADVVGWYA